ncbi:hypothetical protein DFA_11799 [Cavenderia fasciculata]|uniref:F-box domain-containing protein n=1 Tax=Cavenderia fasciculata TaxID=261658 RepID=F4QE89_CACFS|nr:uncharacterized protein DFA_11799 [Cavenderia fasciculata]EGG14036.1 hypothetical protein DFA_11799 [Cavenderia fasciculata]|eukprot:XP_004350744.1 hypothetical protein DFA_11799 [Cavenderia fasciculata]
MDSIKIVIPSSSSSPSPTFNNNNSSSRDKFSSSSSCLIKRKHIKVKSSTSGKTSFVVVSTITISILTNNNHFSSGSFEITFKVASFFNKLSSSLSEISVTSHKKKKKVDQQQQQQGDLSPSAPLSPITLPSKKLFGSSPKVSLRSSASSLYNRELISSSTSSSTSSSSPSNNSHMFNNNRQSFFRSSFNGLRRKFSISISGSDSDGSTSSDEDQGQGGISDMFGLTRSVSISSTPSYDDLSGSPLSFSTSSSRSNSMDEFYSDMRSGSPALSSANSTPTFRSVQMHNFYLMNHFPEEVELNIISRLHFTDILSLSMVNKHFNRLANERTLWKQRCQDNKWEITNKFDPIFDFKSYFLEKTSITSDNCFKWSVPKFVGSLPSKRFKHTATFVNNKIIFIGGQESDTKRFNEIIYYDTETHNFTKPIIKGDLVPNFSRHSASLVGNNIYVFGGFDGKGTNYDLAVFNTVTKLWTNIPKSFLGGQCPVSRTNHASVSVGHKVYIFGGNNNDENGRYQVLDDLHVLDTVTMTWEQPEVTGKKPCSRSGHCMTAIGTKLFLFGGGIWNESQGWTDKFNDIHVFDTETNHWSKPVTTGDVQTSTFAISFAIGRFLFIFGGGSKPRHCVTNDIYILDTDNFNWSVPAIEEPRPPARDMGTACVGNGDVFFMGGYAGGAIDYFNTLKINYKSISKLTDNNRNQNNKNNVLKYITNNKESRRNSNSNNNMEYDFGEDEHHSMQLNNHHLN